MLVRLINTVTYLGGSFHQDSYVINPQRIDRSAALTVDEAKRGYAVAMGLLIFVLAFLGSSFGLLMAKGTMPSLPGTRW